MAFSVYVSEFSVVYALPCIVQDKKAEGRRTKKMGGGKRVRVRVRVRFKVRG